MAFSPPADPKDPQTPCLEGVNNYVRDIIFQYAGPRATIEVIHTSRSLYTAVIQNDEGKSLLRYFLDHLPGYKHAPNRMSTWELLRALIIGVKYYDVKASCREYQFNSDIIDHAKSILTDHNPCPSEIIAYLVNKKSQAVVSLGVNGQLHANFDHLNYEGVSSSRIVFITQSHGVLSIMREFVYVSETASCLGSGQTSRRWRVRLSDENSEECPPNFIQEDVYVTCPSTVLAGELIGPKVPISMAVDPKGFLYVLWNSPGSLAAETAEIVCTELDVRGIAEYTVWGPMKYPEAPPFITHRPGFAPERIALQTGRRQAQLKLFAANELMPHRIVSCGEHYDTGPMYQTMLRHPRYTFWIGPAFDRLHETDETNCETTHLSLAVVNPNFINGQPEQDGILCVVRGFVNCKSEHCDHYSATGHLPDISEDHYSIVAELGGWYKEQNRPLIMSDTIAISPAARDLAAILPHEILVWRLDARSLCEIRNQTIDEFNLGKKRKRKAQIGECSDEEFTTSTSDGCAPPDTSIKRSKTHMKCIEEMRDWWPKEADERLGYVLPILKPIVLDLKGAKASKVVWRAPDKLVVLTDRSVQLWFWNRESTGEWETKEIDLEKVGSWF